MINDYYNPSLDELKSHHVTKRPVSFYYRIHLPSEFKYRDDVLEIIKFLGEVTPYDAVDIFCCGYGGSVQLGTQLINAVKSCQGDVKVIVNGDCWSMHAIFASFHPNTEYQDLTYLMFHNISHFSWGKMNETMDQIEFYKTHLKKYFDKLTGNLLTKKEIDAILKGKDIYLDFDDIKDRLKTKEEKLTKKKKSNTEVVKA